jgi:prephenate dehydratase
MVNKQLPSKLFYLGHVGSFHSIVCKKYDKENKFSHIGQSSFEEIFLSVLSVPSSIGIVAYTNKIAGNINEVHELLNKHKNTKIQDYIDLPIKLFLLAKKILPKYKTVYSHPKALQQCSEYITKHHLVAVDSPSTSESALFVSSSQNSGDCCIGSIELAHIYNLHVISENIGNSQDNFTTFAIITKL